ncbi:MAG: tRNA (adenosine(37)-N6)-dimethylallyltransferase MiaA [Bacteroidales bacterium]|jgi:tRNA dimethylallyltransferase|nr:tRNA (adenosine(37)-N6)-dimethylallyltransferase MiaA [Bacteroidales bacterium]
MKNNLLVILGPTAGGKTSVAAHWAHRNSGEIISADSRQVYRGMTIGTGKDYADYMVDGQPVLRHCIDIAEPGDHYNVYEYQKDFLRAYNDILIRGKTPVLCGGSGMYIEAAINGYRLIQAPMNEELRKELETKTDGELTVQLASLKTLHNSSDTDTRKRMVRAIEIAMYRAEHPQEDSNYPEMHPLLIGVKYDRESRRRRITQRLRQRLDEGMVEEAQSLLDQGLTSEQLEYYGLEYRFLAKYIARELNYTQMFEQLNTAIHQFAKRQMTWFRRMERNGATIWWLDGYMPMEEKLHTIDSKLKIQ